MAKEFPEAKSITITSEGSLEADFIDKKMLIDKHHYAIASKATLLTPDKLLVPNDKFFTLDVPVDVATVPFTAETTGDGPKCDEPKCDEPKCDEPKCDAFDKSGDGYARGEGFVDLDISNQLACITGAAINQDDRSASMTAEVGSTAGDWGPPARPPPG